MSTSVEKLIEQVRRLSAEDQKWLRQLLDQEMAAAESAGGAAEEAFQRHLVRAGLLTDVKRPRRNDEAFKKRKPIAIKGKPLSETIVEERR